MPDGQMRGTVETENRLHNPGVGERWDRRLPGELPDMHLWRGIKRAWRATSRFVSRHRRPH